jgi:transposase
MSDLVPIGRTQCGLNSRLHVVCGGKGSPLITLLSEGQMSDYKGAALMIDAFPKAKVLLGDKGYDADWFRAALGGREIIPCIPSKANRKVPLPYDPRTCRQAQGLASYPYPLRSFSILYRWR